MKKSIVIIEDDTDLQEIYYTVLSEENYSVHLAGSATLGMKLVQEEKPDLVILDIMLPGTHNGYDVLKKLAKDEILSKIPVMVISNLDTPPQIHEYPMVVERFVKPNLSMEKLIQSVGRYTA